MQTHKDENNNSFIVLKGISQKELDNFLFNIRNV